MAWVCIKENLGMGERNRRMAYMVETDDISTPPDPDYSAIGSVAFTAAMDGFWVKAGDGTWTESTADALALLGLV